MKGKAFFLLGIALIIISFIGYWFFNEPITEWFNLASLGGICCLAFFILFQENKPKAKIFFSISTFCFSMTIGLIGIYLASITYNVGLWLFILGLFSYFIPITIFGSFIFDRFQQNLAFKLKTKDNEEVDREDNIVLKTVAFFQSTFFILSGLDLLTMDYWFITTFLASNVLFFLFRGYAVIRKSNRNRYRSTLILFLIPAFDVLIILRNLIADTIPLFYPEQGVIPIPINLNIIFINLIFFGIIFSFLRKMLLNRYELPEDLLF